jgi:ketosteroid isomerase-like protein
MSEPIRAVAETSGPAEIFNQAWEAYKKRDWEALRTIYAETAELTLPGAPPIKGRDQIIQTWQRLAAGFPDEGGDYSYVISQDNIAGGEKLYHGTNTGPLAVPGTSTTLPPTGKRISVAEADFIVVENGLVMKHTCYYDRLAYAAELGIMGNQ